MYNVDELGMYTSSVCIYLCEEEQVFSDGEVVEEHVVLRTQTQAAADQSHIMTDVVTVNVRTATAGREKAWEWRDKESLNDVKKRSTLTDLRYHCLQLQLNQWCRCELRDKV